MDSQLDGLRDPPIRGATQARVKPYGSNIVHYLRECSLLRNPLDALLVWSVVFFTRNFCYYYILHGAARNAVWPNLLYVAGWGYSSISSVRNKLPTVPGADSGTANNAAVIINIITTVLLDMVHWISERIHQTITVFWWMTPCSLARA
jgi:hypothetical protein